LERLEDRTLLSGSTLATAVGLTFTRFQTAQAGGFLAELRQHDLYRVHLGAGDVLHATVSTRTPASGLQSLLRLFDASGTQVALDDREGGDPQVTFQTATAGNYYVGVSSAPNDAYDPTLLDSGTAGGTIGLYTLNLRDTPAEALRADLTGASFRLNATTATYGETVSGTFRVENRGGADARPFQVQLVVAKDGRFDPASSLVLATYAVARLGAGQEFLPGPFTFFTATLPDLAKATAAGLPGSGPVYLGLRIDAAGAVQELNPFDQRGVHRGSDWETLTIVTPITASGKNHDRASVDLLGDPNSRVNGTLTARQTDWYQLTGTETKQLRAKATAIGASALVPRLTLADQNGQELIQSDIGTIAQNLPPGTYYLLISARSGAGRYQLTIETVSVSPPLDPLNVGNGPAAVTAADVNGDGKPDLIVANANDNTVSVLLGNSDGTFQPPQTFDTGFGPSAVAVADVNGDGKPDLIVANTGFRTVSVLLGNGDGTFQPQQIFDVVVHPSAVAVADVNGDGNLDLVVASSFVGTVSVLLGDGHGHFQPDSFSSPGLPHGIFAVGNNPSALAVADVDGDGTPDLVVTNQSDNTVSVLLGHGDGSFESRHTIATGLYPSAVAVADFNGDGKPDLAVANQSDNTVRILVGNGNGTFQPDPLFLPGLLHETFAVGVGPSALAVADVNGDGIPDLVVADGGSNTVSVLLGHGDATFQAARDFATGKVPLAVAVADLDGDGKPDLVVANQADNTVSVMPGNGDGSFEPRPAFSTRSIPYSVAAADVNGDGKPDLVVANYGSRSVSVLRGNGDGAFQPQQTFAAGNGPAAVAVADVNGDGKPDVIVANSNDNTVSVLLGNGDGTFQPQETVNVGVQPIAVTAADINGDGKLDLIVANAGDNTVSVLLGNGDGTFQPQQTVNAGGAPSAVAVADANGDGKPDLIVANRSDNTVSVLLGNGDGSFQPQRTFPVGAEPFALAVVDVNGDGEPDLVVANRSDNTVSVLLGDGHGAFQPAPFSSPGLPSGAFFAGFGPSGLAVADVNGDGKPDLIVTNLLVNTVSVLLSNGAGNFQPPQTFATGTYPVAVAAADVNGDGRPDVIVTNRGDNTVTVLLGNGDGKFAPSSPTAGTGLRNTPCLADVSGDGIPDSVILDRAGNLLFREGVTGHNDQFAPPVVLNPGRPARDLTLLRTGAGWAIATADSGFDRTLSGPNHFVYTVSVYAVGSGGFVTRTTAFSTSLLPTRIAAADLTGDGLDDLVVTDSLDRSIQVAFQRPDGSFESPHTLPVGETPSDIALVDLTGDGLPDLAVTNQASGDVSVFLNTGHHAFAGPYSFRAGTGLYGLDRTSTAPAIQSLAQPVSLAAGPFTGDGRDDLVIVNRGTLSFTLLPNDGSGGFADAQPALTTSTSDGLSVNDSPGPIVAGYFHGPDQPLDLAVLMEDSAQVWIYTGDGHGQFSHSFTVPAGGSASGLSVVRNPQTGLLDLLVGNPFGDILHLQGNGDGTFHLAGARVSLDILNLGNGQSDVLVANQRNDRVSVQARQPGSSSQFVAQPLPTGATTPLAPGDIRSAILESGTSLSDAVVMSSGGNNVLVYRMTGLTNGQPIFAAPVSYAVGTDPVSVTIQDINHDGIADMLVADYGSNDVMELFGSYDAQGNWVGRPGPRLKTGGFGPIGVDVRDMNGDGIPDLVVTNGQSGTLTVLPGVGQGFFSDQDPQELPIPGNPVLVQRPAFLDPPGTSSPNSGVVVTTGGQLVHFDLADFARTVNVVFTPRTAANGIEAVKEVNGDLVAVENDGTLVEFSANFQAAPTSFTQLTEGTLHNPSGIDVVETSSGLQALVTEAGDDQLFVFGFSSLGVTNFGLTFTTGAITFLQQGVSLVPASTQLTPASGMPLVVIVVEASDLLAESSPELARLADQANPVAAAEALPVSVASSTAQVGGSREDAAVALLTLEDSDTRSDLGLPIEPLLRRKKLYDNPELSSEESISRQGPAVEINARTEFFARSENEEPHPVAITGGPVRAIMLERPPGARNDAVWLDWPLPAAPGAVLAQLAIPPQQGDVLAQVISPVHAIAPLDEGVMIDRAPPWKERLVATLVLGSLALWSAERFSDVDPVSKNTRRAIGVR
jgi:hypothetical protein